MGLLFRGRFRVTTMTIGAAKLERAQLAWWEMGVMGGLMALHAAKAFAVGYRLGLQQNLERPRF